MNMSIYSYYKPERKEAHMTDQPTFTEFYEHHYPAEHKVPANIAFHMVGTVAGVVLLMVVLAKLITPWWALAFPVVHVVPGLIGHRLFERNEEVGDARLTRTDVPLYWFMIANHLKLWALVTGRQPHRD
jgi:hypothetical protein